MSSTIGIGTGNVATSSGDADMYENTSIGEVGPGVAVNYNSGATHGGIGFTPSGNGVLNFLGITARTTWPASLLDGETNNLTDTDGFPLTDAQMAQVSEMTPLLRRCVCKVIYKTGTAVNVGGKLMTSANGEVTAWDGTSAAAIIGECRVVGGMGPGGGVGLAYIY